MLDCPQIGENNLFIGQSTMDYHIEYNGLITAKDITKGTILCIKRGIMLTTDFLNYSDYNCSNITYIRNKDGVHLLDKIFYQFYKMLP